MLLPFESENEILKCDPTNRSVPCLAVELFIML